MKKYLCVFLLTISLSCAKEGGRKYYQSLDFYTMHSGGSLTLLEKFKTFQQTLFLGHIVLEKLIKAYFVKKSGVHAPYSHDLRLLAKKCEIKFPDDMTMQLDVITSFNINTRYDSFKEDFQKRCTPEFSNEWINNIKTLRQWIKERL